MESLEQRTFLSAVSELTPSEVLAAYGFNQIKFKSGSSTVTANGAGQTIAIVDAYGSPTISNDLRTFDKNYGISDNDSTGHFALSIATPEGSVSTNGQWSIETALDVEWAHAIAPGAHILLVEAKSSAFTDLFNAVNYARQQNGVVAVSMSWGGNDFNGEQGFDSFFTTPANHIGGSGLKGGVSFVASTGDNGLLAAYPATSPKILAVGGTVLSASSTGQYLGETAWRNSSGGTSSIEHTNAPAVSYDAGTGFAVYDGTSYGGRAGWWSVGGTSAGAPQWAALLAIADQGRALEKLGSLDGSTQTVPTLLRLAQNAFHDITTGSNNLTSAKVGYDLVTGRGTPFAQTVIAALVGGSITVSSSTGKAIPMVNGSIAPAYELAQPSFDIEPSFAAATNIPWHTSDGFDPFNDSSDTKNLWAATDS